MTRSYEDLIRRLENLAPAVETEEVGRFAADGRSYPMFVVRMGGPAVGRIALSRPCGARLERGASESFHASSCSHLISASVSLVAVASAQETNSS